MGDQSLFDALDLFGGPVGADDDLFFYKLHGIDAPESGQADGDKCTAALRGLLAGREVTLRPMSTDRYGRTVGMVHADSANVNASGR